MERDRDLWYETTVRLYSQVADVVEAVSKTKRTLFNVALVFSTATSGALWVLVTNRAPVFTAYVGAGVSTVTTLIMLYLYSGNFDHRRRMALELYEEIGALIARIRSTAPLSNTDFWAAFKKLEARVLDARNPTAN